MSKLRLHLDADISIKALHPAIHSLTGNHQNYILAHPATRSRLNLPVTLEADSWCAAFAPLASFAEELRTLGVSRSLNLALIKPTQ